jgi:hypothetical protein
LQHQTIIMLINHDNDNSLARLKVYRGTQHPHVRQLPFPITLPNPELEAKRAASVYIRSLPYCFVVNSNLLNHPITGNNAWL